MKPGDKVVCVRPTHDLLLGGVYTVKFIAKGYRIEFDNGQIMESVPNHPIIVLEEVLHYYAPSQLRIDYGSRD